MSLHRLIAIVAASLLFVGASSPPAGAHDVAKVKRQIRVAWQGNDRRAIRVAKCESSLDPKAVSPSGTYRGLWQFDKPTWKAYGGPGDDPIDVGARKQTEVAWRLYQDRGWDPWPTCGAASASTADVEGSGPQNTDDRRNGDVSRR
jgi:hypothetical protein